MTELRWLVKLLFATLVLGVGAWVMVVGFADWNEPTPTTTTTTIDFEYARCFAIQTHRSVLDYRDLETAQYLADVACNDGKVEIPYP